MAGRVGFLGPVAEAVVTISRYVAVRIGELRDLIVGRLVRIGRDVAQGILGLGQVAVAIVKILSGVAVGIRFRSEPLGCGVVGIGGRRAVRCDYLIDQTFRVVMVTPDAP